MVDGNHAGFCGNPFTTPPTAFVGPHSLGGAPSCTADPMQEQPARDGIWLVPGDAPVEPGPHSARTPSGVPIELSDDDSAGPTMTLWFHGVQIELGIGPDPAVARAILSSLRPTPARSDTPVGDQCPTSVQRSMPTPERLSSAMTLEHGNVTLEPPGATDRPTMTAAQAWSRAGSPQPGAAYWLILARYSAKIPARLNPDGSLTPLSQNVLVWIVSAAPAPGSPAGCAMYGLSVYDATTGAPISGSGYSPGP